MKIRYGIGNHCTKFTVKEFIWKWGGAIHYSGLAVRRLDFLVLRISSGGIFSKKSEYPH